MNWAFRDGSAGGPRLLHKRGSPLRGPEENAGEAYRRPHQKQMAQASGPPFRKRHRLQEDVLFRIENHAARGAGRLKERRRHFHGGGKKPCVANCATAREIACWV